MQVQQYVDSVNQLRKKYAARNESCPELAIHSADLTVLRNALCTKLAEDRGVTSLLGVRLVVDDRIPPVMA